MGFYFLNCANIETDILEDFGKIIHYLRSRILFSVL